ncbi:hypothetical protein KAFR_0C01240 [Kazachstania africana CBS 2517]|uniref:RNA exonuclease 4 n=1 Tax=Kazachstania africana (strain ATCC 22294 / BCRC 22015 / CBS 2517 / CECT 1963 / NBRC 1671 / NRRL Y-8276) TaxID=1071382 RepID=H2ARW9_KAZAF|nr:hypothetical protein KAFR_0C01240 [Kazachstania africana CBS 2517]CCF57119.1 hypothetical protein KAFR_0C01240 [Kazachstania africana CBS 2517]
MVLSSNWLELQQSKKVVVAKKKKNPSKKVGKIQKHVKVEKPNSKIMDMVYSMTRTIKTQELRKKEGQVFEFRDEVSAEVDTHSAGKSLDELDKSLGSGNKKAKEIGKYVAMDCEFVGVGPEGKESALARISLTNYFGHVIMDEYVKPREKITDWRTWVSGIKPEHMKNAITFKEAQKRCTDILKGRILVGHAVKHDLEALFLSHPNSMTRDTSRHIPFRQAYAKGKPPSLKKLAKEVLKLDIQGGEHSSVEDSRATMLIYKSARKEFERLHKAKFSKA